MAALIFSAAHARAIKILAAVVCVVVIIVCTSLLSFLPSGIGVVATVVLSMVMAGALSFFLYVTVPQLVRLCKTNPPEQDIELGTFREEIDGSHLRRRTRAPALKNETPDTSVPVEPVILKDFREIQLELNPDEMKVPVYRVPTNELNAGLEQACSSAELSSKRKTEHAHVPRNEDTTFSTELCKPVVPPKPSRQIRHERLTSDKKDNNSSLGRVNAGCMELKKEAEPGLLRKEAAGDLEPQSSCPFSRAGSITDEYKNVYKVMPRELREESRELSFKKKSNEFSDLEKTQREHYVQTDEDCSTVQSRANSDDRISSSSASLSNRSTSSQDFISSRQEIPPEIVEQIRREIKRLEK